MRRATLAVLVTFALAGCSGDSDETADSDPTIATFSTTAATATTSTTILTTTTASPSTTTPSDDFWFMSGHSMDSTIGDGWIFELDTSAYETAAPSRGDIVVLQLVVDNDSLHVKRVIGLPGEVIDILDCAVYIDGQVVDEPYIDPSIAPCTESLGGFGVQLPLTVPDGSVFVMGDNRPGSCDSREVGPVPLDQVRGRVVSTRPTAEDDWTDV